MTVDIDEHGRPWPPFGGDEWETLTGFLDYQRATFAWKSTNLTGPEFLQPLPPSSMTMVGLMKHLTFVEDEWFGRWLLDEPDREPWASVDWSAQPDWEWESALTDSPDSVRDLWQESITRARASAAGSFENGGLSQQDAPTLSRRSCAKPSLDHDSHDRGIRAPQRTCRPSARSHRWRGRRVTLRPRRDQSPVQSRIYSAA